MSVREIKDQLAALSRGEQDEVIAFLFHLRHAEDTDYQGALTRRLEDKNPGHWLTPDQFERELELGGRTREGGDGGRCAPCGPIKA